MDVRSRPDSSGLPRFKEGGNMNAYEIAEVIAEYLVDNKELVIAMIKDNDKETLQDEIYAELTEE